MSKDTNQNIFDWFTLAHADQGYEKRTVQTGVHFEEVSEMLKELYSSDANAEMLMRQAYDAVDRLATYLKTHSKEVTLYVNDRKKLLDSLTDQNVTLVGVAYDFHFNYVPAINETNLSNYSKFVNGLPVFDQNGKVTKGPDYFPPNLNPFC